MTWALVITFCLQKSPVCVPVSFGGFQSRTECEITFQAGEYRHHLSDPVGAVTMSHDCKERQQ